MEKPSYQRVVEAEPVSRHTLNRVVESLVTVDARAQSLIDKARGEPTDTELNGPPGKYRRATRGLALWHLKMYALGELVELGSQESICTISVDEGEDLYEIIVEGEEFYVPVNLWDRYDLPEVTASSGGRDFKRRTGEVTDALFKQAVSFLTKRYISPNYFLDNNRVPIEREITKPPIFITTWGMLCFPDTNTGSPDIGYYAGWDWLPIPGPSFLAIDIETYGPLDDPTIIAVAVAHQQGYGADIDSQVFFRHKDGAGMLEEVAQWCAHREWDHALTYNGSDFDLEHIKNLVDRVSGRNGVDLRPWLSKLEDCHCDLIEEGTEVTAGSKFASLEEACEATGIDTSKTYYDSYGCGHLVDREEVDEPYVTGKAIGDFLGMHFAHDIDGHDTPEIRCLINDYAVEDVEALIKLGRELSGKGDPACHSREKTGNGNKTV